MKGWNGGSRLFLTPFLGASAILRSQVSQWIMGKLEDAWIFNIFKVLFKVNL